MRTRRHRAQQGTGTGIELEQRAKPFEHDERLVGRTPKHEAVRLGTEWQRDRLDDGEAAGVDHADARRRLIRDPDPAVRRNRDRTRRVTDTDLAKTSAGGAIEHAD